MNKPLGLTWPLASDALCQADLTIEYYCMGLGFSITVEQLLPSLLPFQGDKTW